MNKPDPYETRLRPAGAASTSDPAAAAPPTHMRTESELGAPGEPPALGDVLGERYELQQLLGQGGMGVVFLAYDRVEDDLFAIKVLKPDLRENPNVLAALHEEVRKTRALAHPNIVGVYSLNRQGGRVYVVMEHLQGKPLDQVIKREFPDGMPFAAAWPLLKSAADGLSHAHDRGIIHSDLKPQNLFLTAQGTMKVLDFGIARVAWGGDAHRFDPSKLGALTPAYASPEMLAGESPDVRDDVYGFGCVVYELLTGAHPFGRSSATHARDRGQRLARLATLSRTQHRALARALSFNRESRTPSIAQFMGELGGVWLGLRDTVTDDRWRKRWRHAAVPAAVVAALLIGGGIGGFKLWQQRVDEQTTRAARASWINAGKSLNSLCRESREFAVKRAGLVILARSEQTPDIRALFEKYKERLAEMQRNMSTYATNYNNDLQQLRRLAPGFIAAARRATSVAVDSGIDATMASDLETVRSSQAAIEQATLMARCVAP